MFATLLFCGCDARSDWGVELSLGSQIAAVRTINVLIRADKRIISLLLNMSLSADCRIRHLQVS